ncbi:MAG TPA: hypothetical protein VGJ33_13265 [Candidatus Angelobacter sp.]|jgi:hypothetical protein
MKILAKVTLIFVLASSLFAQPAKNSVDQLPKKDAAETQEAKPIENFYKLTFAVYELEDGKRVNQRDYTVIGKTNSGPPPRVSVNTRIPVFTEEKNLHYIDAGLTLNCAIKEHTIGRLELQCDTSISGFVRPEQSAESRNTNASAPVLRSSNSNTWAILTPGKSMIISSIDDVNSTKRTQIEVTATKID